VQQTCGKEGERIKWSYIKANRQVLQRDNEFLAGCSHPIATSVRFPGLQPQAISTHMAGSFHQRLLAGFGMLLPAAACSGQGSGQGSGHGLGQHPCASRRGRPGIAGSWTRGTRLLLGDGCKEVAGCFFCLAKVERPCKSGMRRGQAKAVVFWCYKHLNNTKNQRHPAFVCCGHTV